AHKWLAPISLTVDAPQSLFINTLFDKYMCRYQDATYQFYSGRRERDCLLQFVSIANLTKFLDQFCTVPMSRRLKGTNGTAAIRMMAARFCCSSGCGRTYFRLHNKRYLLIDNACTIERK